ncbi:PPE family protein [Mycobacterium sp. 1081908.1]|uniref:PPE family protein n=1 Tax=Mycobacterium sp. 1081908.1 TaxID=1834066 RepID=UPI0007FCBCFF|nr:PPE family protein [Mycobacterium sp. 1081908.1]OBK53586.1 hypothetical protein A5655_19165 [Mycobacterium sp. 1081908.1]
MDFGALPPEVNSGRMYLGPGPATLLAASAGWESLAGELIDAASGYQSVIAGLTDESWLGPTSLSMAAAMTPYLSWMTATAAQCTRAAAQATAVAAAFEAAYAMTVPPPLIAANRARLIGLIATNVFGQNTPAVMATEAEYSEMWAQDATVMYRYAANSAAASAFSPFTSPPRTTNPGGLDRQIRAVARAAATLTSLATPGSSPAAAGTFAPLSASPDAFGFGSDGAALGRAGSLGTLSVPPSWADAVSSVTPLPALDANVMPGGWGAAPSVRRRSVSVRRVLSRTTSIPRSPVAG